MTNSRSLFSTFAMTTAVLLATACGGAVDSEATNDVAESQDALTFIPPIKPPITNLCLNAVSPASFTFHCGAQGFRRAGAFDGGTNTVAYNYAANPAPWDDRTSFPSGVVDDPIDQDGALLFGGFDQQRPTPSGGLYRVDFISPDLLSNVNWQGKTRYRFRIREAFSLTQLFGQIVLEVQKADGSIGFFREVNAQGQSVFCNVPHDAWTDCAATIPLPASAKVKSIQLRVFGDPNAAGEGIAFIDEVAPIQ